MISRRECSTMLLNGSVSWQVVYVLSAPSVCFGRHLLLRLRRWLFRNAGLLFRSQATHDSGGDAFPYVMQ